MYLKWSWGIKLRVLHMLGTHLAPSPPVWTFVLLGVILLEEQGNANFCPG